MRKLILSYGNNCSLTEQNVSSLMHWICVHTCVDALQASSCDFLFDSGIPIQFSHGDQCQEWQQQLVQLWHMTVWKYESLPIMWVEPGREVVYCELQHILSNTLVGIPVRENLIISDYNECGNAKLVQSYPVLQ